MTVVLLQGFSSGIPLALTAATLQAWLTDQHVDIRTIGLLSMVGLPYSFKFVWAPLLDRVVPPFLGRRRGWLLVTQLLLILGIAALGFSHPAEAPFQLAVIACCVAFFSASQDIVIDAYRIELLPESEYGAGIGLYTGAYRAAMLVSGGIALGLADHLSWRAVYLIMASTMLVGLASTLMAPEPNAGTRAPRTFVESVYEPLSEFFGRRGSLEMLAFIVLYKLDTFLCISIETPFFLQLGFSKTEVAATLKLFGMIATIVGVLAGGAVMTRLSQLRSLVTFGLLQAIASASFVSLAYAGKSHVLLIVAIFTENFFSGLGIAALSAFMMSLVNKKFSATQYALLSSLMALPRYLTNGASGFLQTAVGWKVFYVICAFIGIPGLLMLRRYNRWAISARAEPQPASPDVFVESESEP